MKLSSLILFALLALTTVAVTWLLAHEGHAPLPSRGVDVRELDWGRLTVSREARVALDVQTAEVEARPVAESLLAYATLTAPWQQHAFASSRLSGKIAHLLARPGQVVAAGETLAEVESLELENLQLEILNAANDLHLSEQVVADLEKSDRSGSTSPQQLIEAQSKHRQNRNALEVARGKWLGLGLAASDLDRLLRDRKPVLRSLPIRSPVRGTVIHADLTVGKVVEPLEHLFEIMDLSTVWVQIGVLENDVPRVQLGQPVALRLSAYPGEVFHSTVRVKGYLLDARAHLNTVWAEISNPSGAEPRFLPGLAGEADLLLAGNPNALSVPVEALLRSGADSFVLVEETGAAGGSQYQKRSVVVGRSAGGRVEVASPDLFPGDHVVTQGGRQLADFFIQGVLRPGSEASRNMGLTFAPVSKQVVEDVVEMDGAVDLSPDRRAQAASPLAGTLAAIRVDRGQQVKAGDVLAEVVSLDLLSLQLELLRAHLDGQLLEDTLKRVKVSEGLIPRRRVMDLESEASANRQKRDSLQRKLLLAGLTPEQLQLLLFDKRLVEMVPVRSPIDGVVVSFDRVLGQAIKADEALFAVHDLRRPLVVAYVSERDLHLVRIGQPVRARFKGDPSFVGEGKVVRSGRVLGPESRTLTVWIELGEQPTQLLRHGQIARLTLTVRRPPPTLAVPLTAVVQEGTHPFVFVRLQDGAFERRAVELGRADDRNIEIIRALHAGEVIAVRGAGDLQTAHAAVE
jgi:RND family efflux transporter MFP subunit